MGKNKNKSKIIIVSVIIIVLIAGGIAGYLYYKGFFNHNQSRFAAGPGQFNGSRNSTGRNFQLNQSQIDETNSFFNSNPSQTDIQNYCNTNRINCAYYCRTNPSQSICQSVMNFSRGNFTRGGRPSQ